MDNIDIMEQKLFDARKHLSSQDQSMVNDYIKNNAINPIFAFVLWFFLGAFGAHRFLFKKPRAWVMVTLEVLGWLLYIIGFIMLLINFIWWIIDVFYISSWLKENRIQLECKAITLITGKTVTELANEKNDQNDSNTDFSRKPQNQFDNQTIKTTDGDDTDFSKPNE